MFPYFHFLGRDITAYGILMALGFITACVIGAFRGKSRGVSVDDLLIVAALAVGGALLCGGGLYIFVTYPLDVLTAMIKAGDFSFLTNGGIVFYGGLVGGILGGLLGSRIAGCSFDKIEKTVVPVIPLGHGIGRIGCLMAGCCHGMPYDGPLAVHYPNSVLGLPKEQGYFPVQALEALLNVGICICLVALEKRIKKKNMLIFSYLGIYAVVRFCLEYLRGDEIRGIYFGLSVSQWIAIGMLAVAILGILVYGRKKRTV